MEIAVSSISSITRSAKTGLLGQPMAHPSFVQCGIPQGPCLGLLLFTIYSSKLFEILKFQQLPTAHADDSQLHLSFSPVVGTNQADALPAVEPLVRDVRQWMLEDKLMLYDDNMYGLLTKCEVKMAKFFFCVFMDRDEVEVHKPAKKERGQYPAILTEQTWSIKDLLYGFW